METFAEELPKSEDKKSLRARRQEEMDQLQKTFPGYFEDNAEAIKDMTPEDICSLRRRMEAPHKARGKTRERVRTSLQRTVPIDPSEKWASWSVKADDVAAYLNALTDLDPVWEPQHILNSVTGGHVLIIAKKKNKVGRPKGN